MAHTSDLCSFTSYLCCNVDGFNICRCWYDSTERCIGNCRQRFPNCTWCDYWRSFGSYRRGEMRAMRYDTHIVVFSIVFCSFFCCAQFSFAQSDLAVCHEALKACFDDQEFELDISIEDAIIDRYGSGKVSGDEKSSGEADLRSYLELFPAEDRLRARELWNECILGALEYCSEPEFDSANPDLVRVLPIPEDLRDEGRCGGFLFFGPTDVRVAEPNHRPMTVSAHLVNAECAIISDPVTSFEIKGDSWISYFIRMDYRQCSVNQCNLQRANGIRGELEIGYMSIVK